MKWEYSTKKKVFCPTLPRIKRERKQESENQGSLSRLMVTRREEAREEEQILHPKLTLVRDKMKLLKGQVGLIWNVEIMLIETPYPPYPR